MPRAAALGIALGVVLASGCSDRSGASASAAGTRDLRRIPSTARFVASADLTAVKRAPIAAAYLRLFKDEFADQLALATATCDVDVIALIGRVTIGLSPIAGRPDDAHITAVVHGQLRAKLLPCISRMAPLSQGVLAVRGDRVYVHNDAEGVVAFVGDDEAVLMVRPDGVAISDAAIDAAIAGTGSVLTDTTTLDLIDHLDTAGTAWGMGDLMLIPDMSSELGPMTGNEAMVGISAHIGDDLRIELKLRTADEATAATTATMMRTGAKMLPTAPQRLDITTVGRAVIVSAQANDDQLALLVRTLGKMF